MSYVQGWDGLSFPPRSAPAGLFRARVILGGEDLLLFAMVSCGGSQRSYEKMSFPSFSSSSLLFLFLFFSFSRSMGLSETAPKFRWMVLLDTIPVLCYSRPLPNNSASVSRCLLYRCCVFFLPSFLPSSSGVVSSWVCTGNAKPGIFRPNRSLASASLAKTSVPASDCAGKSKWTRICSNALLFFFFPFLFSARREALHSSESEVCEGKSLHVRKCHASYFLFFLLFFFFFSFFSFLFSPLLSFLFEENFFGYLMQTREEFVAALSKPLTSQEEKQNFEWEKQELHLNWNPGELRNT